MKICGNIPVLLLAGWVFVSGAGCKNSSGYKPKPVSGFSWLNGSWVMKDEEGTVTEQWKTIHDSLLEGSSDFIKGDSVIPFEKIRLFRKENDFYYEARAAGQNHEKPVSFRLTSFSGSGFVAENPGHDFPKRITYRLGHPDSIHAFVDGGPALPERRSDFHYSRVRN